MVIYLVLLAQCRKTSFSDQQSSVWSAESMVTKSKHKNNNQELRRGLGDASVLGTFRGEGCLAPNLG